ncbi:MAG TPA: AAA family ATPase [Bacillota bacterium]
MSKEVGLGTAAAFLIFLTYIGFNILPVIFLVALAYVVLQSGGLRGAQRRFVAVGAPSTAVPVTFGDIGGQPTAKKELLEALDFIVHRELISKMGIRPLKGILLTGPPGTGKTLLAKAAANYTDSVFLSSSGSEFIEVYAGVGAQRIRQLFTQARETAAKEKKDSAIIFIDEIEVLGGKRGQHTSHLEYDQTLNQLLVEMDGLTSDELPRILLIGATNRFDLLDQALLRPGRIDRIVNVDLPDREGRLQILALHIRNKPMDASVDLDRLAKETFGFSGAHLESLANEAAILALREKSEWIQQRHLEEAVDKVIMGEKLERRPTGEERRRVAYHEAGHAIMAEVVRPGSVSTISITSRGGSLGHVRHTPEDDFYLSTREYLEGQIQVALAGAVAEEIAFGSRSTGAMNDFQQAVEQARRIIRAGLSDLGIVSPETLPERTEHREIGALLRAQEGAVREFLGGRREALEKVASIVLDRETLSGDEVRRVVEEGRTASPAAD